MSASDRLRAALAAEDPPRTADAAMEIGPAARDWIHKHLRPAFDAVCDAFALYESGNDDAAREKLNAIGLSSPFLDWKLLLRGLIAHAAGDDARALDNWSRLAGDRLAAKLVAPLRFALDPAFRTAQPPAGQPTLQRAGDRLIGGLTPGLRALQGLLTRSRLADAFRQAELVLPQLKIGLPQIADRLGECFRAAIISHGVADDVNRYRRTFGPPADDLQLCRLEALAAEMRRDWKPANAYWQAFETSIIDNPAWPATDRDRARALIWTRMGRNATEAALDGRRLQPNAETCFKRAIQLDPDLLEPYEEAFLMLRARNRHAQAVAAGKRLLKKFPDHGKALEAMTELCHNRGEMSAALDYAHRAVAANPLDARLRDTLADGLRGRARALASIGEFKAASTDVAEALRLRDGRPIVGHLALAAAIAFKAGDTDAAENQVRAAWAIAPAAAAYTLAIEATRFKLANPLKQRFEAEFAAALAAPPTGPAAIALTEAFFHQSHQGNYTGQKGHEKQIQAFAEAAIASDLAESDLVKLCEQLDRLDWLRLLKKATTIGQRRFPRNPFFPFFEATCLLTDDRASTTALWKIEPLLEKARRLAEIAPPDDAIRKLLRDLDNVEQRFSMPPPVAEMFEQLFGMFDKD